MTTKRTHDKRPTETNCEINMEKVPFQPVALALTDVGIEIFLRMEDKPVSADNATQQVKSQGASKPEGLKMTSNQTNNAAMLSPNSYPNNKKSQQLRFNKNVQVADPWMEDDNEDRNYMDYKFSSAGDDFEIGKRLHQTAAINDERFLSHVERVEDTEAPLWDVRRMATDRIMNPDAGSKPVADFRMDVEDDSDDTTDVDSDLKVTGFHEWLARRRIRANLIEERNLLKSRSSRTAANSKDYRMPIRHPFERSGPSKGQNNHRRSVSETKKYDVGNLDLANDRLDKRNSNLAKERYGGLFHDQRTESGYKYRSNSLAVDGCTCLHLCNKISPIRPQEKRVKYGDACASNSVFFCQRGPGGACHGYQTSALDNVSHKPSATCGTLRKLPRFDAASPDRERQDNADNNTDGCIASPVVHHANNCTTCNEDEDRKGCNACNGNEEQRDLKDVDKSDPQTSQSRFNLADLPEESRNAAAIAKFKEYSRNMKKEIRISRTKMNNLVIQFNRIQAKNRPQSSYSTSTVSGKDGGFFSSLCPIL